MPPTVSPRVCLNNYVSKRAFPLSPSSLAMIWAVAAGHVALYRVMRVVLVLYVVVVIAAVALVALIKLVALVAFVVLVVLVIVDTGVVTEAVL